jgi:hypothetical protein
MPCWWPYRSAESRFRGRCGHQNRGQKIAAEYPTLVKPGHILHLVLDLAKSNGVISLVAQSVSTETT